MYTLAGIKPNFINSPKLPSALKTNIFAPHKLAINKNGEIYFYEELYQEQFYTGFYKDDGDSIYHNSLRKIVYDSSNSYIKGVKFILSKEDQRFNNIQISSMVFNDKNELFIADKQQHIIFKLNTATGQAYIIAGNGTAGYNGDGKLATTASLNYPSSICLDKNNNLLIADKNNHRIRHINLSSGIITTIAGIGKTKDNRGDGRQAIKAGIIEPSNICVDHENNIYFTVKAKSKPDQIINYTLKNGYYIKKIDNKKIITTICGQGKKRMSDFNHIYGSKETKLDLDILSMKYDSNFNSLIILDANYTKQYNGIRRLSLDYDAIHHIAGATFGFAPNPIDRDEKEDAKNGTICYAKDIAIGNNSSIIYGEKSIHVIRYINVWEKPSPIKYPETDFERNAKTIINILMKLNKNNSTEYTWETCYLCGGSGGDPVYGCGSCNGKGKIKKWK